MEFRQHNFTLDGSDLPYCIGDRQYAQDKARDFWHLKEYVGMVLESYLEETDTNITISGCVGSQGAGHTLSWTAGKIKVPYTAKTPTDWSALPPPMTAHTIPIIVDIPAMTNQAIASATTDGVTTNYAKFEYNESTTSSRTRAKKAGAYDSEVEPSYTFTCDSTPPTASEVSFATFTSDGATLTFTDAEQRFDGDYFKISNNLSEGVPATMRTNLGVVAKTAGGSDPFTGALYIQATTALLDMYDTDGTTGYRRYRLQNTGSGFKIQQQDDAGTPVLDIFKWDGTDKIVFGDNTKIHNDDPYFQLYDTGGTANKRKARLFQGNDLFGIFLRNDDDSANKVLLKYDWTNEAGIETLAGYRSGATVESEVMIKTHVLQSDVWNMNTDATNNIGFSSVKIDYTKIVGIQVLIVDTAGSNRYDLIGGTTDTSGKQGYYRVSSNTIFMGRLTGGDFDNATFNAARAYAIIRHYV